jgi:2-amino-4-hydroxy-6-hydroxymethyldihydropteridine diphosphokinase
MSRCLIGLGSNQGNRRETLDRAVAAIGTHPAVQLLGQSRWHETRPVGGPPRQPAFLNGAVLVETSLEPQALLQLLRTIETHTGRSRLERWGPRTLDLDLLLFDDLVLDTRELVVPHPRMAWRRFVLEPAAEVAGPMLHPVIGCTVRELLDHLNTAVPYVAIAGGIGAGKSQLGERLASIGAAELIAERIDAARLDRFYADPPSHAWQTELEFLEARKRLLDSGLAGWAEPGKAWVSDFWFDQSLAFARVWLEPPQLSRFQARWNEAQKEVVPPKLLVLLDVPGEELFRRVQERARPYERGLSEAQLDRIRRAVRERATRPGQGPLLRLIAPAPDEALEEVRAALAAMQ